MDELEIIQFQQLQGLNIFVNTVTYRSPHFHQEWELLWVLDAPLKVKWQLKEAVLQPGDMVLFPPRIPHEFLQVSGICTFLCLQVSPSDLPLPANIVTEGIQIKEYLNQSDYRQVQQDILEIAENYFSQGAFYELLCIGKSALLLHTLLQRIPSHTLTPEEVSADGQQNARLMRLTQYVEENYTQKIRLADFAKLEGCSVSYLSHFIKNTMNQTFQDYVNSVRFSRACKLIAEGKLSMLSVSTASGFSDYRYFSRAFQKAYGMTPAEYSRKADAIPVTASAHIQSAHSQERFLTRGQSLGILQHFRNQLENQL